MKAQTPLVSIGMPVYNGENYVASALTRLLQQDFENFELIVSDNASTDQTAEICRAFAKQDPRVRYARNEKNIGLAANHNRTIELARGKYFKWAAHDDDFPKHMLTRFVSVLENQPSSVVLVYSPCEYVNEAGQVTSVDSDRVYKNDPRADKRFTHVLENVHMYSCFYGLMRTEALRRTRLLGLYPMSDHVLLGELAILGTLLEIPEPLLRIRRHGGRTFTANKSRAALRDLFTPGRGHRFSILGLRSYMHLQIIVSAMTIPTSVIDKARCTAVALVQPQWKWFKAYAGIQKRNLKRLFRSAKFSPMDVQHLSVFTDKLKDQSSSGISRYIASQLSPATRDLLLQYRGGVDLALQTALVEDLNRIVEGPPLYDAERFDSMMLSRDLQNRLSRNPSGADLIRVNRLLLEEAYPVELSKKWRFRVRPPVRAIVRGEA